VSSGESVTWGLEPDSILRTLYAALKRRSSTVV
jgi:hypothetical protein